MEPHLSRFVEWHCAPCFKIGRDGALLFYPWSYLGKGYLVPTPEAWEKLHRWMSIATLAGWAPALLPGWYVLATTRRLDLSLATWVACSTAVFSTFFGWLYLVLRGLQPVSERMSSREVAERRRTLINKDLRMFIRTLLAGLALLAVGVGGWERGLYWPAIASAFGLAAIVSSIWSLRRSSRRDRPR